MALLTLQAQDEATPLLRKIVREMEDLRPLTAGIAEKMEGLLRDHFTARDLEASARTEARYAGTVGDLEHTHYWSKKADRLESYHDGEAAYVLIPLGDTVKDEAGLEAFARYFGDVHIEAQRSQYLTIPAQAMSYGHRAGEFPDLHFIPYASGAKALAMITGHGKDRQTTPLFWLLHDVRLPEDKTVLPTDEQFYDTAEQAAERYFANL